MRHRLLFTMDKGEIVLVRYIEKETICGIGAWGQSTFWQIKNPHKHVDQRRIVATMSNAFYSRERNKMYVGSGKTIYENNVPFGEWEPILKTEMALFEFDISENGNLFAIATGLRNFPPDGHDEGEVLVVDAETKTTQWKTKFRSVVTNIAINREYVACGIEDETTVIFNRTGAEQFRVDGSPADLEFTPDGKRLCIVPQETQKIAILYDLEGRNKWETTCNMRDFHR